MSRAVQLVLLSAVILTCLQTGAGHDNDDVAGAVLQVLLPYINDLKDELRYVKNDLANFATTVNNLNVTVSDLSGSLKEHKLQTASELAGLESNMTSELAGQQSTFNALLTSQTKQICQKMDILNASMREELRAMESQLKEHNQQTTSELAGLQSNMTSELAGLQSNMTSELARLHTSLQFNTHSQQLTQLCEKVNMLRDDTSGLKGDLSSLNDTMNRISDNVEAHDNHVTTELMEFDQNLQQNFTQQLNILPVYICGGTGGWRRVVCLDFTDPNTPCPSGWQLTSHSKRTCGRVSIGTNLCDSVTFPVSGGDYTRVCGRIIAYQDRGPGAFAFYNRGWVTTIDGAYVDGVSLTHGSPRQHIWTFAAGWSEGNITPKDLVCPCNAEVNVTVPPFVGGDYFCESGRQLSDPYGFLPNDPLWDGDGCRASNTCCSFNNPPYFTKQLSSPTTDDIEARLCHYYHHGILIDTPIEFIELYVQ